MSSMFSSQPWALKALYATNALWFTSAVVHFGFRPEYMMRRISLRRDSTDAAVRATPGGDRWHQDLMRYLGGINSSLAALTWIRLITLHRLRPSAGSANHLGTTAAGTVIDLPTDLLVLTALSFANASQALLNTIVCRGSGRWICGNGWDRITVLDAAFAIIDIAALACGLTLL